MNSLRVESCAFRRFVLAAVLCAGMTAGVAGRLSAQQPPAGPETLSIGGDVAATTFTLAALKTMARTQVTVEEDGRPVVYEGVALAEILKRVGAPVGAELRGDNLATYLLATARDGYQVVFSLAEVDAALTRNDVIVADSVDGKPLFAYQGPLRIVAPRDARPARSVRMLERIDVIRLKK